MKPITTLTIIFFCGLAAAAALAAGRCGVQTALPGGESCNLPLTLSALTARSDNSDVRSFEDSFDGEARLEEASTMEESAHPGWWLNSGAFFIETGGAGRTVAGKLAAGSPWQTAYAKYNPSSTDDGYRPQNIFRLITRSEWQDADQSLYFRIAAINPSESEHRNESNGVLLFHRYRDSDNLYYAGVRVDGAAVIKKKIEGTYHTLASAEVFPGSAYDRQLHPNRIPLDRWIGIRSTIRTNPDDTVTIRLFIDREHDGNWEEVLETTDTPDRFGVPVIRESGFAGIRSDFMDVWFDAYHIEETS